MEEVDETSDATQVNFESAHFTKHCSYFILSLILTMWLHCISRTLLGSVSLT